MKFLEQEVILLFPFTQSKYKNKIDYGNPQLRLLILIYLCYSEGIAQILHPKDLYKKEIRYNFIIGFVLGASSMIILAALISILFLF